MQQWYAIQTKPHKEFLVRDALGHIEGVQTYLPVLHVQPVNPRARKVRAFFPGYLFAQTDLEQVGLSTLRWNPGVARVLGTEGVPSVIPESVIEELRRRVDEVQGEKSFHGRFRHGDRVQITTGPFAGFEGMFDIRLGGQTRARILVEFVGRLTTAEVDIRNLENLERDRR